MRAQNILRILAIIPPINKSYQKCEEILGTLGHMRNWNFFKNFQYMSKEFWKFLKKFQKFSAYVPNFENVPKKFPKIFGHFGNWGHKLQIF
jgi:hypothetical protein